MEIISKEDKEMLTSLWRKINDPKYYELRDQAWQLIDFLQRVEKAECGFPTAPVPAPSGLDWINPNEPIYYNYTPILTYSDTNPNKEWQKSVRYL